MNQVLSRVEESMELLSNRVLDTFPSRIDREINGFAWGLEVNNGGRERELLLCFEHAEVRKKRQIAPREEGERYIYPQPPTVTAPKGSGETEPVALRLGETEPVALRSGETKPVTLGLGETELAASRSGEMEPMTLGSGETF